MRVWPVAGVAAPPEPLREEQAQAPCTPPPPPERDLTPEQLHQGWAVASAFLRSRLQDSTGSAASTMPLRPSLEKLKVLRPMMVSCCTLKEAVHWQPVKAARTAHQSSSYSVTLKDKMEMVHCCIALCDPG